VAIVVVYLVEADAVKFPAKVDSLRTNAENAFFLESTLGVDRANCHGGRQCWGYRYCHYVQHSNDHYTGWLLHNNNNNNYYYTVPKMYPRHFRLQLENQLPDFDNFWHEYS